MVRKSHVSIAVLTIFSIAAFTHAEAPADPKSKAIYDHDKEWLSHFPPSFVATNIRGHGRDYAERRIAALDLVRQQRDFGVVSELIQELDNGNFLSPEICDLLGEWKAKRAIPRLKAVQSDPKRPKEVRDHAAKALIAIQNAKPDPTSNPYATGGPGSEK